MTAIFVGLPVTNLERSKTFYEAIGLTFNPQMSDHNAACFIVEEGHSFLMLMLREFFQTFTDLPIGDPAVNPSASTSIYLDTREAVDKAVTDGIAAGAAEPRPAADYGFMYQRGLTDPDGNAIEFGWFDPAAADTPAVENQQA